MKILYLHQYFTTRSEAGGTRSYEFSKHFLRKGHEVTMITSSPAVKGLTKKWTTEDGVEVIGVLSGLPSYQKATSVSYGKRIRAFLKFAIVSSYLMLKVERPDVVFATSTPLTVAIPALVGAYCRRLPLVFEVRDLWPEVPIQMGALKNPIAIAAARYLEKMVYKKSRKVIALSPGMKDGVIAAGKRSEDIAMIPNASDLDLFSPSIDGSPVRDRLNLKDMFVCTYVGTMGEANDLTQLLDAAKWIQESSSQGVAFLLVGDGKRRPALEAASAERELMNVIFLDPVPKREVPEILAASDLGIVLFKSVPALAMCSPNKLFDILAAGRPALVNLDGWIRGLMEEGNAGIFVAPDDGEGMAKAILQMKEHPDDTKEKGRNARRLAERKFDRTRLANDLLALLEEVAAPANRAPVEPGAAASS